METYAKIPPAVNQIEVSFCLLLSSLKEVLTTLSSIPGVR